MKGELQSGYDLVLLIFPRPEGEPAKKGTLAETAGQLKTLFKKAGMIRYTPPSRETAKGANHCSRPLREEAQ
jgi:hypothetical protein